MTKDWMEEARKAMGDLRCPVTNRLLVYVQPDEVICQCDTHEAWRAVAAALARAAAGDLTGGDAQSPTERTRFSTEKTAFVAHGESNARPSAASTASVGAPPAAGSREATVEAALRTLVRAGAEVCSGRAFNTDEAAIAWIQAQRAGSDAIRTLATPEATASAAEPRAGVEDGRTP